MNQLTRPDVLGLITDTLNAECEEANLDPAMVLESMLQAFVQMAKENEEPADLDWDDMGHGDL